MAEATSRYSFTPSDLLLDQSNVARFMKRHALSDWRQLVQRANADIEWYWDAVNNDLGIEWFSRYEKVCDQSGGVPLARWFVNGKCNIVSNAVDRHAKEQPNKVAYVFADQSGSKKLTYGQLEKRVSKLAGALSGAGIRKGDVVGIYMPMVEEAFCAILACSKIGAVHTAVFSGYSSQALHARLVDSNAKMLFTADSLVRKGKEIDLRGNWTSAVQGTAVKQVISTGSGALSYSDFVNSGRPVETSVMDSEDPLFILYTSGTTGAPKGTVHVHGGFTLVAAQQAAYLIDMKPSDILFWYADIGWITGQVWSLYGSAIIGGTSVIYDDALDYPDPDTWCNLIEQQRATIFGVAPTALRHFMKNGSSPGSHDLSSLRILATTGEPINSEAWDWYFHRVGGSRCPVINVSGGTEIGGAILGVMPVMSLKPCTVGCPVPGFDADVFDEAGNSVRAGEGYLVIKKPWPSMTRGLLNSPGRFAESYWSKFKGVWYHGDVVLVDSDGLWYMRGRADDVIKVSGHRLGTAEIEEAATSHPAVAEAAAVGRPDDLKGESIVLCVVLKPGSKSAGLSEEIKGKVEEKIGRFARPDEVYFLSDLPKTRTGKLVRRLLRAKAAGHPPDSQDVSSVENPQSLEEL